MKLKIGDWIKASYLGDSATGFITRIYPEQKSCVIQVTHCADNKALRRLDVDYERIISHNFYSLEPEDIRDLIEITLITREKEWFYELTSAYQKWIREERFINKYF